MKRILQWLGMIAVIVGLVGGPVYAQSSSNSYRVDEYQFGTGSEVDLQSSQYRANASTGALGVGSTSSANYDAEAGYLTPSEPFLEFVVNTANIDLGTLSTGSTASGSGTFYVRSYLSDGYNVTTVSQPPTNESGFALAAMSTLAAPSPGTEQFGINLVANTVPTTFGADPANTPSGSFADGEAASGYNTANQFKYVVGDTVARAPKTVGNQGVGRTDYTVSYIANTAPLTRAGLYVMQHDLVATASY